MANVLVGEIRQATGHRYPDLEKALPGLDEKVLWDFHRLMQDIGQEMAIARKRSMWPGGPRI